MIDFDILFYDPVAYRHYDASVMQQEPLGGTEATVIRVAEELARRGLKVGVMNAHTHDVVLGDRVYHMGVDYAGKIRVDTLVSIRGIKGFDLFPNARLKYSWQHDAPDNRITAMLPKMQEHAAEFICVSDWHKTQVQYYCKNEDLNKVTRVRRIYNPIDEFIGRVPHDATVQYNRNVIVWAASPHKGLDKALEQFRILRDIIPSMELRIFNPGYLEHGLHREKGVQVYGAVPCRALWQHMSEALCVFYPTNFEETFGLIAAEANAVHTPIATMGMAGLNESVQTDDQLVGKNEYAKLLQKVENWYNNPKSRPQVCVQPRFRIQGIGDQWMKLINR